MKDDAATTVRDLKEEISHFVSERDWQQFHSPKNLSMAIATEVGELMEHFRWLSCEESNEVLGDPDKLAAITDEFADVMMLTLEFASVCGIDATTAVSDKLRLNQDRYPVDKAKGSNKKHNEL